MRQIFNKSFILIILILTFMSFSFYSSINEDFLNLILNIYNNLDMSINNGEGYSNFTNDLGYLAWGESYILESYIDMFLLTNDYYYLNKFIEHANKVILNSDIYQQRTDFKNRIRYGWSSKKYSINNVNHIHLVHTGMITFPLLLFSFYISKLNLMEYFEYANRFTDFSEKCISEFDSNYFYDPIDKEGYYFFDGDEPIKTNLYNLMPCNSVAAINRSILLLYLITGETEYYYKALSIAKFFKNKVFIENNNKYIWGYRPLLIFNKIPEDYSHGSIEISMVDLLFQNNIIFNIDDINLFINTFLSMIKDDDITYYVDGKDNINKQYKYITKISWWLELSKYNFEIYYHAFNYIINNYNYLSDRSGNVMLTISKLARYYPIWEEKLKK